MTGFDRGDKSGRERLILKLKIMKLFQNYITTKYINDPVCICVCVCMCICVFETLALAWLLACD